MPTSQFSQQAGSATEQGPSEYNVVFKRRDTSDPDFPTWIAFKDKAKFEEWYAGKMKDGSNLAISQVFAVIAEGCSANDAQAICRQSFGFSRHDHS